ncbi:serine/threonine protein kinase [Dankookia rubra]|uniref:Serine/threonine protein kinase n=1 Tax=Dankookia rubra TaxID=1442381 RepID=A0A4R5QHW8_9PROT|nr:serine/threonine-protein kinase [Dankookia rubra]TDH62157.1 serine/threonine protein kinase [Dankookia rubra]
MMPGRIGQFEIKHVLGSGGFGTVYAAIDTELGRWVAIKTLRSEVSSNPAIIERFRAEGFSLSRLNHTHITTLYGMPRVGQDVYLVMELVNGYTLDAVLAKLSRLNLPEIRAIVAQAAIGLGYAHRMGVIHRDIKPSNLMLNDSGCLKIMDFGISRIRGTQRLTRGGLVGTYAYLAPEQFRGGEGSERSDLYSLACVVYEMLTGHIPFDAPTEAEIMRGHLELPVRPLSQILPGIDPGIDQVVQRALAKNPADRFESVHAFSDALGASALERAAADLVQTRVLARMPPSLRPTVVQYPPSPSQFTPGQPPVTDLLARQSGSAAPKPDGTRGRSRLVLGAAVACVAAGGGLLAWRPWETAPVVRPVVEKPVAPDPAKPKQDDARVVPRPDIAPARPSPMPPVNPQPDSPFLPRGSASGDSSPFIPPKRLIQSLSAKELTESGRPAAELVAEATRRLRSEDRSQVDGALMVLRYAAQTLRSEAASATMARLFDPNQPNRPVGLQPDVSLAAQNYRAAFMAGDKTVGQDREALRAYLERRAQGSNAEAATAAAVLDRFWR